jgi:hypothetical protein
MTVSAVIATPEDTAERSNPGGGAISAAEKSSTWLVGWSICRFDGFRQWRLRSGGR